MSNFDDRERNLLATADEHLSALPVARSATEALMSVVDGAAVEPADDDAPPSYFVRCALLLLSAMALRTARAILLVVSAGYEPEAQGLKRRLSEIHARALAVSSDDTGQHARRWLEGKGPGTSRKLAGKWGDLDLYDTYSVGEHADARGVHWWLTVPILGEQSEQRGIMVPPHRRPSVSNVMLTEVAMECRDLAAALAFTRGGGVQGLDELDVRIEEAQRDHLVQSAKRDR